MLPMRINIRPGVTRGDVLAILPVSRLSFTWSWYLSRQLVMQRTCTPGLTRVARRTGILKQRGAAYAFL